MRGYNVMRHYFNKVDLCIKPIPIKPCERKYAFSLSGEECYHAGALCYYIFGIDDMFNAEYRVLTCEPGPDDFTDVLGSVFLKLMADSPADGGFLSSRSDMLSFMADNPDALCLSIPYNFYAFRIDVPHYVIILRLDQLSLSKAAYFYVYLADKFDNAISDEQEDKSSCGNIVL